MIESAALLRRGMTDSLPLGIGLLSIGLALGAASRQAGLSWWMAAIASAVVYAGPAQFLAMSQVAAGAATGTIVLTTFITSLRYLLFSFSLARHLVGTPRRRLPLLAHAIADGSYALTIDRARRHPGEPRLDRYLLGTFLVSFVAWVTGGTVGAILGAGLPADVAFALAFASPAIFIALLAPLLRGRVDWLVAVVAGFGSVAGARVLPSGMETLLAIVTAALVGGIWTWERERRSS